MLFSDAMRIPPPSAGFDFLNIDVHGDTRLFLDAGAILDDHSDFSEGLHHAVSDYFQQLLTRLRSGDRDGARGQCFPLREDNSLHLGYSTVTSRGRGMGMESDELIELLEESDAFKSGLITDIRDAQLLVPRVGPDLVSDTIAAIGRHHLCEFTTSQCQKHDIEVAENTRVSGWIPGEGWSDLSYRLPVYEGKRVILVPARLVRRAAEATYSPNRLVTDLMDRVDAGNPTACNALTKLLQHPPTKANGTLHRSKTRKRLGTSGKDRARTIASHLPGAYSDFKNSAKPTPPPSQNGDTTTSPIDN